MSISRRTMLYSLGGASVALVGAGGLFAATRRPNRALQAWNDIQTSAPDDVRLDAFRHAILAPNPHNRQPWQIRLVGADQAFVTCDLERRLPQTDPFDRQILIGFGCFLEIARMAAAERGVRMDIEPFPSGTPADRLDGRPIAGLRFVSDPRVAKDPLFKFIATRRSNKQPFDLARTIDSQVLADLADSAVLQTTIRVSKGVDLVAALRALTWDAWLVELKTTRTWQETVDLMRIGKTEIEANPDGVSIGGAFLEALALAGQLSREQMAAPGSTAYNTAIDRYRPVMASGMAYGWVTTEGNTRSEQLATGRAWVRMNLEATRHGLGFHPVSQALQEFKEMELQFIKLHALLDAKPGQRIQMLARLGYGNVVPNTPRWPLQSKIIGV